MLWDSTERIDQQARIHPVERAGNRKWVELWRSTSDLVLRNPGRNDFVERAEKRLPHILQPFIAGRSVCNRPENVTMLVGNVDQALQALLKTLHGFTFARKPWLRAFDDFPLHLVKEGFNQLVLKWS